MDFKCTCEQVYQWIKILLCRVYFRILLKRWQTQLSWAANFKRGQIYIKPWGGVQPHIKFRESQLTKRVGESTHWPPETNAVTRNIICYRHFILCSMQKIFNIGCLVTAFYSKSCFPWLIRTHCDMEDDNQHDNHLAGQAFTVSIRCTKKVFFVFSRIYTY